MFERFDCTYRIVLACFAVTCCKTEKQYSRAVASEILQIYSEGQFNESSI